ncbi:uncharacterized protein LOC108995211 [Juglans regia]|uniref:Uncharacterized protein LOC108995211 n=1 Tax=Juglans regia TaxID=51240 RepID=A0A2I4F3P7_JUGRE|nr:uncharacterized protein LOC108995211 [Juglans regia]
MKTHGQRTHPPHPFSRTNVPHPSFANTLREQRTRSDLISLSSISDLSSPTSISFFFSSPRPRTTLSASSPTRLPRSAQPSPPAPRVRAPPVSLPSLRRRTQDELRIRRIMTGIDFSRVKTFRLGILADIFVGMTQKYYHMGRRKSTV